MKAMEPSIPVDIQLVWLGSLFGRAFLYFVVDNTGKGGIRRFAFPLCIQCCCGKATRRETSQFLDSVAGNTPSSRDSRVASSLQGKGKELTPLQSLFSYKKWSNMTLHPQQKMPCHARATRQQGRHLIHPTAQHRGAWRRRRRPSLAPPLASPR